VGQAIRLSSYFVDSALVDTHIEQRQPILDRLQREADQEANSEDAHALLGHMIRTPLDERRSCVHDRRNYSNRQSGLHPDTQRVRALAGRQGADISGGSVANRAIHRREKLMFGQTRAGGGLIVESRPDAGSVRNDLSHRTQCTKRDPKRASV
jgi:hypothetical protein